MTSPSEDSVVGVSDRQRHAANAELLRRVLEAFPPEEDEAPDRAVRRYVEGAAKASELAAGTQRGQAR